MSGKPGRRIMQGEIRHGRRGLLSDTVLIILIIIISGLIIARFVVQTVRTSRAPLGRVLSLYREAKFNEGLARKFGYRGRVQRFRTERWQRHKRDVDFLPEDLRNELTAAYEKLYRLNETIDAAAGQQESHLNTVNTSPVYESLKDIRRRLDDWIKRNLTNPLYAPRRPRFLWW